MIDKAVTEAADSTGDTDTAEETTDRAVQAELGSAKTAGKGAQAPADKSTGKVIADAAADKGADKGKATSVLDDAGEDGEEDDKKVIAPADWPADWREKAVADISDEKAKAKELKRLQRMKSPADVYKSYRALEQKLKDEYIRRPPDEEATDEQKAQWRKEVGVPDKPEDYKIPDIKGVEWSEADKPIIADFLTHLHKAEAPQAQVDAALSWYAKFQVEREEAVFSLDQEDKTSREDELRAELGPEYRPSINLLGRLLKDEQVMPKGLGMAMIEARMPDGHRLINHPAFAQFFLDYAKGHYGDAAMISGDAMAKTKTREKEINEIMAADIDRYYREGLDKELAGILKTKSGGKRAA